MRYATQILQGSSRNLGFAAGVVLLAVSVVMFASQARAEDAAKGVAAEPAAAAMETDKAPAASADTAVDVAALWKKHCKSCHGTDGKGRTKAGRAKKVKDFTDPKVVAEFDRCEMIKRVTGGVLDDKGKARMKPFAKKLSKAEIAALVDHVIGLSK